MLRKILLSTTFVLAFATAVWGAPQTNVLGVKTDIDTTNLIVPESFEVDVHNLMTDWYLSRYAEMDKDADSRKSVVLSDEEYISRLQKLPTVIEMPFNSVVKSFIKMYVERKKGLVESMLGLGLYYMPMFESVLDRHGVPLELKNLAIIESALNPTAVSRAGATGLWQFMAPTAQGEGLEISSLVDERRDPYKSTEAAARYLKKLYNMYNDWTLAIAAYNCGPGNVNKALRRAGSDAKDFWEIYNYLPAETRSYIPAFIAANYAMAYYKDHNISPVLATRPVIVDSVHVNKRVHFQQISDVLGIPMEEIRALNPQYRTDLIPGDVKPYALVLPHIQTLCYVAYEDSIINHNAELYARRDVVEPGIQRKVTDNDGNEFVEQTIVKYHKIRAKETIASIANQYGVTQSEVIRANGGRKALKRGKTIQINVIERRPVAATDSISAPSVGNEPTVAAAPEQAEQPAEQAPQPVVAETPKTTTPAKPAQPKTTTHTVKSGDTLFKIANLYGVTVDAIKTANNIKGDNIVLGAKLKIPAKGSAPAARKTTAKRKRRR